MQVRSFSRAAAGILLALITSNIAYGADTDLNGQTARPISSSSVFDEVRFEVAGSLGAKSDFESGVFLIPSVFLDPLGSEGREGFDKFLHPRFFLSASISTDDQTSQIMAGASWKFPLFGPTFADLGFGGALNNGNIKDGGSTPGLGSHLLFHEYIALGVNLDENWSLTATIRHSSNAELASPNSGLTYGGIGLGRSF